MFPRKIAAIAAAGFAAAALAGCGGGGGSGAVETTPIPADIRASVAELGGNADATLTEVEAGRVYRTPNGYLYGYCSDIDAPTMTISGDVCASTAPTP